MTADLPRPAGSDTLSLARDGWQPPKIFTTLLLLVLLAILAFHVALFHERNSARLVTFEGTHPDPGPDLVHSLDLCLSNGPRLLVRGWIAKRGTGLRLLRTRVLIRDRADGRLYGIRTDLMRREDVRQHLNARFHDTVDYGYSGFTASLNLRAAGRTLVDGQVLLAYDDGTSRAVVPLACEVKWPR